jgi:hypothetical protein
MVVMGGKFFTHHSQSAEIVEFILFLSKEV